MTTYTKCVDASLCSGNLYIAFHVCDISMNILTYLKHLISYESVSPKSAGVMDYVEQLLRTHGFAVITESFGNNNAEKTDNLYAVYGNSKSPNICFAGHVDVVPPGDLKLWSYNPFNATEIGDKIYGRGTVDMKGALSCALAAAIDFTNTHSKLKGSISFLLTSDEEGNAKYGTQKMLAHLAKERHRIDFAILGEPTSEFEVGDTVKIGRRGSVNFTLNIIGSQGHVAYPQLIDNPINHLVEIIHNLINTPLDYGTKAFSPSGFAVTSIDVENTISNITPQCATAKFNIRFNDMHDVESLLSMIKKIVEIHTRKYEITYQFSANCFMQEANYMINDFVSVIPQVIGITPNFSTKGGTSDARFIKDYCQVIECGLLHKMAHKIDEYTTISDLQRLYRVYYGALNKMLL